MAFTRNDESIRAKFKMGRLCSAGSVLENEKNRTNDMSYCNIVPLFRVTT